MKNMKKCFFLLLMALLPCYTFSAVITARHVDINIRNNTNHLIICGVYEVKRGTLSFPGSNVAVDPYGHLHRGLITARMSGGNKARGTLRCIFHEPANSQIFYLNYRYEGSTFRRFTRQITLEGTSDTSPTDNVAVVVLKQRSYKVTSYDPKAKPLLTYVIWSKAAT